MHALVGSCINGIYIPEFSNISALVHVAFSGAGLSNSILNTHPLVGSGSLQFFRLVGPDNLCLIFSADVVYHFSEADRTVLG